MRRIEHSLIIEAPPKVVFSVITDVAAYPQWNRFTPRISLHGPALAVGTELDLDCWISETKLLRNEHEVILALEPHGLPVSIAADAPNGLLAAYVLARSRVVARLRLGRSLRARSRCVSPGATSLCSTQVNRGVKPERFAFCMGTSRRHGRPGIRSERWQLCYPYGADCTHFVNHESFRGPLAPLVYLLYAAKLRRAFARYGQDLKQRAERLAAAEDVRAGSLRDQPAEQATL